MGRRGRKRWLSVEDAYWKLILAGVGPIEAARRIGIGRTTGFRWRAERGGVAPLRMLEADRHTRYLTSIERERLAVFRLEGLSMREISRRLGRAPSTISRELRRNMRRHDRGKYDAVLAHERKPAVTESAESVKIQYCVISCKRNSLRTGARSRSVSGSAKPTRRRSRGMSATKRSTKPCTGRGTSDLQGS